MNVFFEGQNSVKFRMTNLGNLESITSVFIKYKKPDGTLGQWTATVEDAINGIIFYNLLSTEFLTAGTWTYWSYVIFSDGRIGIGNICKITVRKEGEWCINTS